MTKKNLLRIAGVLMMIAMIALTGTALAQRGGHHRGMDGSRIGKLADQLNLTDAQKTQIKTIRDNFQSQNAGTLNEAKILRETMRQQMKDGNRDGAQAARTQLQAKMETLKGAREQMRSQIQGVLTTEQKTKLDELKAQHKDHCKGKGKRGDRRRGTETKTPGNQMNGNGRGDLK